MARGAFIGSRDPNQHRLAEWPPEEIDRYRQRERLGTDQIASLLAAVSATHNGPVVDFLGVSRRNRDRREDAVGAQAPCQRRAHVEGTVDCALIVLAFAR